MIENLSEPSNDRQAEPKSLAGIALGVADLIELLEQEGEMSIVDADAAVPNFDADLIGAVAGTDDHSTPITVADGVGNQVANHAPE